MKKIVSLLVACISLSTFYFALPSSSANASVRYRSTPKVLRGHWNIRWTDGGLGSTDMGISKRSVRVSHHSHALNYVVKSSKGHYKFYFKNEQPIKVAYKLRNIGSHKEVKSIGVTVGPSGHGYDAMYYKGNLNRYPSRQNTNFIKLDEEHENGIFDNDTTIYGYTKPYAEVSIGGYTSTQADKSGHFVLKLNGTADENANSNGTITITSKLSAISKACNQTFEIFSGPDDDDYTGEVDDMGNALNSDGEPY